MGQCHCLSASCGHVFFVAPEGQQDAKPTDAPAHEEPEEIAEPDVGEAEPDPVEDEAEPAAEEPAAALTDTSDAVDDEEPEDEEYDYVSMTKAELVELAKKRNLKSSGNKKKLIERLPNSD